MNPDTRRFLNVVHGKKNPKTDKVHWHIVGTLMITDSDKMSLHLDSLPVGDPTWNGWLNIYPRDERPNGATATTDTNPEKTTEADGEYPEIPF